MRTNRRHRKDNELDFDTIVESEEPTTVETNEEENEKEIKRLKRRISLKHNLFETGDFTLMILQAATVLVAIFASIPFVLQIFTGLQFNTVLSGSMSGTAEVGDIIQSQPYLGQNLTVGTIVGIEQGDIRYTHRIIEVLTDETTGEVSYITQGDANNTKDLFKPTNEDIWGVVINVIDQPMATMMTVFTWNVEWFESFSKAAGGLDFKAIGGLLPSAPWGLLILITALLLFWWIIPDALAVARIRQAKRDELAMALLKRDVAKHEEDIEEDLKPAIDEYRTVKKENEEMFSSSASEQVWGEIDELLRDETEEDTDDVFKLPEEPTGLAEFSDSNWFDDLPSAGASKPVELPTEVELPTMVSLPTSFKAPEVKPITASNPLIEAAKKPIPLPTVHRK